MRLHEIKLQVGFADAILNGEKTFEIRKNDRGYQKGDQIRFTTVTSDDETGELYEAGHEIDDHLFEVTYVMSGWGLREDFVAFGIRDIGTVRYDELEDRPEVDS